MKWTPSVSVSMKERSTKQQATSASQPASRSRRARRSTTDSLPPSRIQGEIRSTRRPAWAALIVVLLGAPTTAESPNRPDYESPEPGLEAPDAARPDEPGSSADQGYERKQRGQPVRPGRTVVEDQLRPGRDRGQLDQHVIHLRGLDPNR